MRRESAQRVVDGLARRDSTALIDAIVPQGDETLAVTIDLRDVIRIIEHEFLANPSLAQWWDAPTKVVQLTSYR